MRRFLTAVGISLAVTFAPALAGAQQQAQLSAADIETIKKDVKATMDRYYQLVSAQDMKALPEEIFTIPWIQMTGNGPQPNVTKEEALGRWEESLAGLIKSGWGKSVFTTDNVCVLNASAAIASGYNTRYKKD